MKHFVFPILLAVLGGAVVFAPSQTPRAFASQKEHKVAICHGTASAKNPYVLIIVDESAKATHLNGHGPNNAPDFALNGGQILTPEQEAYYRTQDASGACGCPPPTPSISS